MSSSCLLRTAVLIILSGSSTCIFAQPSKNLSTQDKATVSQSKTFDASQSSVTSSPSAQLTVEGTRDDATAKARLGWQVADFVLEVKGSVPIKKTDDEATITDLDGLANKAAADFGLTWTKWEPHGSRKEMGDVCIQYLLDSGKATDLADAKRLLTTTDPKSGEALQSCTIGAMPVGSKYRDQLLELVDWGHPVIATARYKFSNEQFKYALPTAFADQKETHISYGATAALGTLVDKVGLVQLSYQYQSTYKGQDTSSVCTPVSGSSSSTCRDIAIKSPERAIQNILQLETRTFISKKFGLGPSISGDIRGKVASIQIPVYIFKATDGGLNGGIKFGWKSDTKAFAAGVFVGNVLTLLHTN